MTEKRVSPLDALRRNAAAVILAAGLFALVYNVVVCFHLDVSSDYSSDFFAHLLWALGMNKQGLIASFYDGSEHLWHVCVNLLVMKCRVPMWTAAGLVSALADASAYFLIFRFFDSALPRRLNRSLLALLLVLAFVAEAFMLPGLCFYRGVGGVNVWHNPTNFMVRPFAAASLYMIVCIYNRRRYGTRGVLNSTKKRLPAFDRDGSFPDRLRRPVYTKAEIVFLPLCLLLSCYAKPSFMQCFAPGIFVFLVIDLIRSRGKLLPFCIKLALAFIPAGIICCSQYFSFFGSSATETAAAVESGEAVSEAVSTGITFYFLQSGYSGIADFLAAIGSSLWGVLRLLAFPLAVFAAAPKKAMRSTSLRFLLVIIVVAWLEMAIIHETGARASHGNFNWACYLSVWLVWTASIPRYMQAVADGGLREHRIALYAATPLLLWHTVSGILYVIRILQTSLYYF